MPFAESSSSYDFLTKELREQFNIMDTNAVSSNGYDAYALQLIERHKAGLVLDCGAADDQFILKTLLTSKLVPILQPMSAA
jgi:hypothetical protein